MGGHWLGKGEKTLSYADDVITDIENLTKPTGESSELIREFSKADRYTTTRFVVSCCRTNQHKAQELKTTNAHVLTTSVGDHEEFESSLIGWFWF